MTGVSTSISHLFLRPIYHHFWANCKLSFITLHEWSGFNYSHVVGLSAKLCITSFTSVVLFYLIFLGKFYFVIFSLGVGLHQFVCSVLSANRLLPSPPGVWPHHFVCSVLSASRLLPSPPGWSHITLSAPSSRRVVSFHLPPGWGHITLSAPSTRRVVSFHLPPGWGHITLSAPSSRRVVSFHLPPGWGHVTLSAPSSRQVISFHLPPGWGHVTLSALSSRRVVSFHLPPEWGHITLSAPSSRRVVSFHLPPGMGPHHFVCSVLSTSRLLPSPPGMGPHHFVCSVLSASRLHPSRSPAILSHSWLFTSDLSRFLLTLSLHLNVGLLLLLLPPSSVLMLSLSTFHHSFSICVLPTAVSSHYTFILGCIVVPMYVHVYVPVFPTHIHQLVQCRLPTFPLAVSSTFCPSLYA